MWQIKLTTKGQKHFGPTENSARQTVRVNTGDVGAVAVGQSWLCAAVSPRIWPIQLALIFATSIGVRLNGKDVLSPVVVIGQSGASVTVNRAGYRISLKVTYSQNAYIPNQVSQGQCSLCHDSLGLGEIRQCPHCGRSYHAECLGPVSNSSCCPACLRRVGLRWHMSTEKRLQMAPSVAQSGDQRSLYRHCLELLQHPKLYVCLIGCGNIGSKFALQLSITGTKRIVLVDPDRICIARNGKSCPIFASSSCEGQLKVDMLAAEIWRRTPEIEVIKVPMLLKDVGLAELHKFMPGILVGAVDSRSSRLDLTRAAHELNAPLIDLAIGGSPDQLIARARTTWTSVNGISPTALWTVRDWQLLDDRLSCSSSSDENERPVSSAISGHMASVLGLTQIKKLMAGDLSDIGWETRMDLNISSLVRCQLPQATEKFCDHLPTGPRFSSNQALDAAALTRKLATRRARRIANDKAALMSLAKSDPDFSFKQVAPDKFIFKYVNTPGLILTINGVEIYSAWQASVVLPQRYPIEGSMVILSPAQQRSRPFHPNVKVASPYALCYGRFVPVLLLDELSRRLQRIITLTSGAVMTDETDSLNPLACQYVRLLARETKLPLTANTRLPEFKQQSKRSKAK